MPPDHSQKTLARQLMLQALALSSAETAQEIQRAIAGLAEAIGKLEESPLGPEARNVIASALELCGQKLKCMTAEREALGAALRDGRMSRAASSAYSRGAGGACSLESAS